LARRNFDRLGPASFSTEVHVGSPGNTRKGVAFNIDITPRNDPAGATAYAVIVTIDDRETVLSFESREAAERFAETERARLTADEQKAKSAPPTRTPRPVRRDRGGRNRRIRLRLPRLRLESRTSLAAGIKR
jgi:hypothetical protein